MLNSIDADGTKAGYDLVITRRISEAVGVPVVASGGAGTLEHMAEVLLAGKADAVLAASIFHFGAYTVGDVKRYLAGCGIAVRPVDGPWPERCSWRREGWDGTQASLPLIACTARTER